jgi:DNA-binding CsgD family transcriptional regulator
MTDDVIDRNPIIELGLFALIAVLMLADLADDAGSGRADWVHLVLEGLIMVAAAAGVVRLWSWAMTTRGEARALAGQLDAAQAAARQWELEAHEALAGLGAAIVRQLTLWHLTTAEQEIALELLKGLSHKEVAAARRTSERTVRQQALVVYRKAGVRTRSELSAFFLRGLPPLRSDASGIG